MGTIFALLEIAILPLLNLTQPQEGFIAGGSLHEIAHAVAAGEGSTVRFPPVRSMRPPWRTS